ncbi:MAG: hypothetical protein AB8F95_17300 [Bacteroidia bacterium]
MKKYLLVLVALTSCSLALGQSPLLDADRKHELGTSINGLLGNAAGGYGLTYRHFYTNSAFRAGLNVSGTDGNGFMQFGDSVSNESSNNTIRARLRLGGEGHIWLTPKWMVFIGADVLLGRTSQKSDAFRVGLSGSQEEVEIHNATNTLGLAGVLGLRFQVAPRISFGTELRYVGQIDHFQNSLKAGSSGSPRTISETTLRHSLDTPGAIYLQVAL